MQFGKSLFCSTLVLSLAGCATGPLPPTTQTMGTTDVKSDNGSQTTVQVIYQLHTETNQPTDSNLRLISRSDTAAVVGLKTLHFMASMFAGGTSESSFSKDQLRGTAVMSEVNPTLNYMVPKLADNLKNEMQNNAPKIYKRPVQISVYDWYLVYENLSGGDNYELHYKTTVSKGSEDEKTVALNVLCEPAAVKAPLAEWQANNYQKLHDVTRVYMDSCLNDFAKKYKVVSDETSNTKLTAVLQ